MKLQDKTGWFHDLLFPSIEELMENPEGPRDYDPNCIEFRNVIIFGGIGKGKTETIRSLVEAGVEKYGEENVNAMISENGDLELLLKYGLNDKIVQILFCDNVTLRKIPASVMTDWFGVRQRWLALTKRPHGLIISVLGVHRFHGAPKELRTTYDAFIARNPPSGRSYDYNHVKSMIGEEAMKDLIDLHKSRRKEKKLRSLSVVVGDDPDSVGYLVTNLAKRNYLKEVEIPWSEAVKYIFRVDK